MLQMIKHDQPNKFFIQVNTIGLNPAGTLLVSGCKDGTATIWDTSSYTTLQQINCHSGTIHHMAFSPGTLLFSAENLE